MTPKRAFGKAGQRHLGAVRHYWVFGDLLSYIRLFALGISSAILGFVVNDISAD